MGVNYFTKVIGDEDAVRRVGAEGDWWDSFEVSKNDNGDFVGDGWNDHAPDGELFGKVAGLTAPDGELAGQCFAVEVSDDSMYADTVERYICHGDGELRELDPFDYESAVMYGVSSLTREPAEVDAIYDAAAEPVPPMFEDEIVMEDDIVVEPVVPDIPFETTEAPVADDDFEDFIVEEPIEALSDIELPHVAGEVTPPAVDAPETAGSAKPSEPEPKAEAGDSIRGQNKPSRQKPNAHVFIGNVGPGQIRPARYGERVGIPCDLSENGWADIYVKVWEKKDDRLHEGKKMLALDKDRKYPLDMAVKDSMLDSVKDAIEKDFGDGRYRLRIPADEVKQHWSAEVTNRMERIAKANMEDDLGVDKGVELGE